MNSRPASLLVVDDDEMNRDMLSRRLQRQGYQVMVAADGPAALETIANNRLDLVLLDHMMPGMSGLEVLQTLRQSHSPTDLPVIMATALNQSETVVEALNLGANDYVTKPLDFPVVAARVRTQLSRKMAEEALRESEERFALAARGANDGLWDWNLETDEIYYSTRWKQMLGWADDEMGGSPAEWLRRVHPDDVERLQAELAAHREGRTAHFENEHRMLHKDGAYRWMLSRGLAVRDGSGRATRMAGSLTDITEGKVGDALTGLPNRILFTDRLAHAIDRARRQSDYLFAVLFLDLDRFKVVNDSLGHLVGDQLLSALARRLVESLRSTDTVARWSGKPTIARLGGDEFAILLDGINHPADAARVAECILHGLAAPFRIDGHEMFTSTSIGIALSHSGYERPEDLLRDADTAMYRAKALGKARYEVFDKSMRDRAVVRLQLENDLRRAVDQNEMLVHYQPILQLETGRLTGFEALVRWLHPSSKLVAPAEFIPVAEETGLIVAIGLQVLQQACRQMRAWHQQYQADPPLVISVNLSSKQFTQSDLIEQIDRVLGETSLYPRCLKLEITESLLMENAETAAAMLSQLKGRGVQLAIDDFGTGYSSLAYLHRFPADTLKIDRSFVSGMGEHGENSELVRTIVSLAHNLGMQVTAEGVETSDQLWHLRRLGCEYGQGYYFSRPVDAAAAGELIAADLLWCGRQDPTAAEPVDAQLRQLQEQLESAPQSEPTASR